MKAFTLSLFILIHLTASSQSGKAGGDFRISGKVNGIDTGTLYLGYYEKQNSYKYDSAHLDNGFFDITGHIEEPCLGSLYLNKSTNGYGNSNFVEVALEPTSMIFVATYNDIGNGRLIGSESQKMIAELNLKTKEDAALSSYYRDLSSDLIRKLKGDSLTNIGLKRRSDSLLVLSRNASLMFSSHQIEFVKKHPDTYLSAHFLENNHVGMASDTFKAYFNELSESTKKSLSGLRVKSIIDRADSVYRSTASLDFIRKELNGSLLSFASFKKGHYVLIDFWASWCIPCREESPHLIELYKKYQSKNLEIIGVAADNNYIKEWKAAIKKDRTSLWKHVLEKPIGNVESESAKAIYDLYDVGIIPTQVLIDDKGRIVGRYGDKGKPFSELNKKLASVYDY